MKKKIAKIIGVLFLLVVGTLIAAPYFLEAKIGEIIKNNVNDNLNGTLDFADASLSLISSFPNAEVSLEGVSLINKAPFENDTLFAAQQIDLKMSVSQLFNSEDKPIAIERVFVDEATVNITINKEGTASYDIGKASDSEDEIEEASSDESSGFQLNLESYEIKNSKISYSDKSAGMVFEFADFNHSGTGDLSLEKSELDTHTDGLVSFEMDSTNYFKKNPIKLDALLGVDLKENKFSFLKNKAVLNQLALVFDGFVKLNDDNQEVSINFNTLSTDFKNFLALVPESYSKDIENVKTSGDFVLEGHFNGVVDDLHIPKFEIKINSDNAFFKYPDLPKSVKNVFIDVDIINTTGIVEDTFVDIDKLSFMIDEDTFNMMAKIKELTGNTKVNAHVDCKMNLANIEKAYPVPAGLDLKGIFNADITTAFDMASIENEQYEKTQTKGSMSLADFVYNSSDMANPVKLKTTALTFNPKTVTLNKMIGSSGTTDFNATGTINNFLGYMFNDEKVEGNFDLKSDTFALNDFMTADEEVTGGVSGSEDGQTAPEEKIKIPSFLDVNINATANKVLYDDLVLKDVKGKLQINDEKAILSNMTTSIFDGKMAFNGEVSTKNETPTFAMKLDMNQLEIGETFKSLELFKAIAPIAEVLKGKLDSDIELSGNLTDDFMPDLLSLSGDMLANIFPREVDASSTPMLSALAGKLDFVDLKKLNLKDLKTKLSFKDGLVSVKPFTVKYQDIDVVIDGSHTFDKKMNYKASMNVPAKYLGDQLTGLVGNLDEKQLENLTVPVIANIGGNYASPTVTTDITSGIKSLTSQLIEIQKQKLTNQGKDKAKDLLNGLLGGDSESDKESNEKSDSTKDAVSGVLGGLLGGSKKEEDTTSKTDAVPAKEDDAVKDAAKDILGGLFGKKKKKKDSVN